MYLFVSVAMLLTHSGCAQNDEEAGSMAGVEKQIYAVTAQVSRNPPEIFEPMHNFGGNGRPVPIPIRPPDYPNPILDFASAYANFPSDPPIAETPGRDDSSNNRPVPSSAIKGTQPPNMWLHTALFSLEKVNEGKLVVYGGISGDEATANDLYEMNVGIGRWYKLERSTGSQLMYPKERGDDTAYEAFPPSTPRPPPLKTFPGTQNDHDKFKKPDSMSAMHVVNAFVPPGSQPLHPKVERHEFLQSYLELGQKINHRHTIRQHMEGGNWTVKSDVWVYDIRDREWSQPKVDPPQSKVPETRWMHTATLIQPTKGKYEYEMVVFGGCSSSFVVVRDVWQLDLQTFKWTELSNGDSTKGDIKAREGHSAVVYEKKSILAFGGISDSYEILDDLWKFDTGQKKWTEIKPSNTNALGSTKAEIPELTTTPPARWLHTMTRFPGEKKSGKTGPKDMYILFGGCSAENAPLDDTWKLVVTRTKAEWTAMAGYMTKGLTATDVYPPPGRYLHAAVGIVDYAIDPKRPASRKLYVHGGSVNNMYFEDMWVYDVEQNTWDEFVNDGIFPSARGGHAMTLMAPRSYLAAIDENEGEMLSYEDLKKDLQKALSPKFRFRRRLMTTQTPIPPYISPDTSLNEDMTQVAPFNMYTYKPSEDNHYFLLFGGKMERGMAISESSGSVFSTI